MLAFHQFIIELLVLGKKYYCFLTVTEDGNFIKRECYFWHLVS